MKNKIPNKLSEDTSTTTLGMTSNSPQGTSSSPQGTSSGSKTTTVYAKPQDLKKTVADLKGTDASVMVANENAGVKPSMSYLSEVKDKDGKISQPFSIGGKQYQVVRTMAMNKPSMGVYSLDERDEEGKNIIYDLKEFEAIANKHKQPEATALIAKAPAPTPVQASAPAQEAHKPDESWKDMDGIFMHPDSPIRKQAEKDEAAKKQSKGKFFQGNKHFVVNEKTGRIHRIKDIAELASYKMETDEKYMGLKDFKKYLDETLFGKRSMKEAQPAPAPVQEPQAVTHMFSMIDKALPTDVYNNIKQNPTAQKAAITDWVDRVGIPPTQLNDIIAYLRTAATKVQTQVQPTPQPTQPSAQPAQPAPAPVTENKFVIVKTIKVKDLK